MSTLLRLGLLGGLLMVVGLGWVLSPSQAAPSAAVPTPAVPTRVVPPPPADGYQGVDMGNKPAPHFNFSDLVVATPNQYPQPATLAAPGRVFAGATVQPQPALDPNAHVRTDDEIRAFVQGELKDITQRSPAVIRYLGTPEPTFWSRYGFNPRNAAQSVVVVVQCDCDVPSIPHAVNMRWLIWVIDRQHGHQLLPTEGSPIVQELLNDPTIPLPYLDRLKTETGVDARTIPNRVPGRGRPATPGVPVVTTPVVPLIPPPFSQR